MSLSFVKSAVLSSSDGVSHNEEVAVESSEATALRNRGETKSLFAQLQENKDLEAEAEEERRKEMREAMLLNEEDCAHLDAIDNAKRERRKAQKKMEEEEIALFRAAKSYMEVGKEESDLSKSTAVDESNEALIDHRKVPDKKPTMLVPVILGKRRKKTNVEEGKSEDVKKVKTLKQSKMDEPKEEEAAENNSVSGLDGLLGGYGSNSDSE